MAKIIKMKDLLKEGKDKFGTIYDMKKEQQDKYDENKQTDRLWDSRHDQNRRYGSEQSTYS